MYVHFLICIFYFFKGYERINFSWVLHSAAEKKNFPTKNYSLQIGFSKTENKEIENHVPKTLDLRKIFSNEHFLIATTNEQFADDWKPLLIRLGCSVSVKTKGKFGRELKKIDLIIADSNIPSSIAKEARDQDKFIVTTEWIIQCLINGRKVNEFFLHDKLLELNLILFVLI